MSENISSVKKHTCPTCGGQLRVNTTRQMYECPFCGVSFDYEYFREDDVLSRAERSMRAGEFRSAKEAYDFMLTKEPHNFVALRGEILITASAKTVHELSLADRLAQVNFDRVKMDVSRAIADGKPEHSAYFSKFKEFFDTGRAYKEAKDATKRIRAERHAAYQQISKIDKQKEDSMIQVTDPYDKTETTPVHPKSLLIISLVLYMIWCLFIVFVFNLPSEATAKTTKKTTRSQYTVTYTQSEKAMIIMYRNMGLDDAAASKAAARYYEDHLNNNVIIYGNDAMNEKREKEEEEERNRKKEAADRKKALARTSMMTILVISNLVEGALVVFLVFRIKKMNELEKEINIIEDRTDDLSENVHENETKEAQLRAKIHEIYKELVELDPVPEQVEPRPTVTEKRRRKRWS